jgi:hypothetical protein
MDNNLQGGPMKFEFKAEIPLGRHHRFEIFVLKIVLVITVLAYAWHEVAGFFN